MLRGRPSLRTRTAALGYALLLPAFIVVLAMMVYPLLVAIEFSLRAGRPASIAELSSLPLSLDQYRRALTDPATWHSIWLSIVYTVGVTVPSLLIGASLALLLNQRFPGRRWFRTAILLPWALPAVVVVIVFLWMFDQAFGVVNSLLISAGLIKAGVSWFFDPRTALLAVILPTIWKGYPFFTLLVLAALQTIPGELYEAARVDGAGALAQFRSITLPAIRLPLLLGVVLTAIWVFREYDFIYATTQGGPGDATQTLAISVYNEAFRYFKFGQAAALGMLAFLIAGITVLTVAPRLRNQFF